jgi:mono/diheme cytochrome c family protein
MRTVLSILRLVAVPLLVWLLAATGHAADVSESARAILAARCHRCHGQDGRAAAGVAVLDRARLVSARVVVPGDAGSRLLAAVESGRMPAGGPPLSADEVATLREWVLAGAPALVATPRRHVGEVELLDLILADLNDAAPRARPFLRYVSLAHLSNAGASDADLARCRAGVSKLVNSLSWRRVVVVPAAVDPSGVVLRVDLRDYGWTATTWLAVERAYPYGMRFAASDAIASASGAGVPYLRADWFVAAASVSPIYDELLGLPPTVAELERMLGVDAQGNVEREHGVLRAGVRTSGVSQHNRVVERHVTPYGAYWKSYDFRGSSGPRDVFANPVHLAADGGEMIFNLPNGLQGYYLADASGRRIAAGPIEIVADRTQPDDPVVRNGRSCIACHAEGVKPVRDDVRPLLRAVASVPFDRGRALALYPSQDEIDRAIEEDRARFLAASERAGCGTGDEPEPVVALARRYDADLDPRAAAAEVGLDSEAFRRRLALLGAAAGLELEQLAVRGGGIKRAVWERSYGDLVQRMGLGTPVAPRLARGWQRPADVARSPAPAAGPIRRVLVRSKTRFFTPALLENEIAKWPESSRSGLTVVRDGEVDLEITIDRPLFTYTYTYTVTDVRTRAVVLSGKLTAFDGGAAAPKIARELLPRLARR